ncbi:hypothetical protein HDU67_007304 [Dinochytrium kinnereticum]|nr:hypothetical protein HDU67_007304 [Dinochytrium kinnereticum]
MSVLVAAAAVAAAVPVSALMAYRVLGHVPPQLPSSLVVRRSLGAPATRLPLRDDPGRPPQMPPANVPIAVIGGAGFLGGYIVESLLQRGDRSVVILDMMAPKQASLKDVAFVKVDITDVASVKRALEEHSIKIVYLVAALLSYNHHLDFQLPKSIAVNVNGTKNVIQACVDAGVTTLVQTSTSNVSLGFDIWHVANGDEDSPGYTEMPFNHYSRTKVLAEKAMLNADKMVGSAGTVLRTASVRPCSIIWGDGDKATIDRILSDNDIVFFGNLQADYVYVENVAHAHLVVECALRESPEAVGGQAFCVSEDDPINEEYFRDVIRLYKPDLHKATLLPPISLWLLCIISTINQTNKIRRLTGYRPLYTLEEGMKRAIDHREARSR